MVIDKRSEFSASQHLVAGTTYGQNFINLQEDRDIAPGTPLYFCMTLETDALAGTTPTYTFTLQTDDNDSFTSPEDLLTFTVVQGTVAGTKKWFGFPSSNQQYLRLKSVLADVGATADVTINAWLSDAQPSQIYSFPQNIN